MRVLALTRYGRQGASSRMRTYQYLPRMVEAGIEITVIPFFSDAYVAGLQKNKKPIGDVLKAYFQRFNTLFNVNSYDLIWIEKEVLPWLPSWVEKALLPGKVPYVLDYDDAVFHYYDLHHSKMVRLCLGGKHSKLLRGAALVVAGNDYLADYARRAGAVNVVIVPTAVDLDRYPLLSATKFFHQELPCVGWIGQRSTASFLSPFKSLFSQLSSTGLARFSAIGIDASLLGLPMDSIPWSELTEVDSISTFDIGIMPLVDAPFERGKCGYKLIQYMACGLPVVASPVGVNCQIVEHGVNGFLAETPEEWEQAFKTLLSDSGLRQRMGLAGRRKVEEQYCVQVTGPKLAELFRSAI